MELVRKTLRRDLSTADRFLQSYPEKHVSGWAKSTERWRELVLEEANLATESELTDEVIQAARKRADKRWRDEKKANVQTSRSLPETLEGDR